MHTDETDLRLDIYLSSVEAHLAELKHLDPSVATELQHALAESREIMGAMAMYLRQLKRIEEIEDCEDCYCHAA